jgi:hypothetical protein
MILQNSQSRSQLVGNNADGGTCDMPDPQTEAPWLILVQRMKYPENKKKLRCEILAQH